MKNKIIIPQETVGDNIEIIKDLGQTLTFFDDYILFESESESNVEDEKLGMMVQKHYKNKAVIDKKIFQMDTYRSTSRGNFVLRLDEIYIGFLTEEKCNELFDKIIKWKYS